MWTVHFLLNINVDFFIVHGGGGGFNKNICKNNVIAAHCSKFCDEFRNIESCERYACVDAPNSFQIVDLSINIEVKDCAWVGSKEDQIADR